MDIRTLQYFVTIVECGNISIAAKKISYDAASVKQTNQKS